MKSYFSALLKYMKEKKSFFLSFCYLIFLLGLFFVGLEYVLENYFKTSLCTTSSCSIAKELLLIKKKHLLLIAFVFYTLLLVLLFLYHQTGKKLFRNLLLYFLTAGLIADAYLIFFLYIEAKLSCPFCLGIFVITLGGTILTFFYLKDELISPLHFLITLFFALLTLFLGFFVSSTPPIISKDNKNLILIYSQNCPICQKTIEISENLDIPLKKIPLSQAFPLMKTLNLKNLPCLLDVKEKKIEIYTNFEDILHKLNMKKIETNCEQNKEEELCVIP
jgi:uncharacterized membrane protein